MSQALEIESSYSVVKNIRESMNVPHSRMPWFQQPPW